MQKANMHWMDWMRFYTHAAYEECENNTSTFTHSEYVRRQQLSTDTCCMELSVCGMTEWNKGSENVNIKFLPAF